MTYKNMDRNRITKKTIDGEINKLRVGVGDYKPDAFEQLV